MKHLTEVVRFAQGPRCCPAQTRCWNPGRPAITAGLPLVRFGSVIGSGKTSDLRTAGDVSYDGVQRSSGKYVSELSFVSNVARALRSSNLRPRTTFHPGAEEARLLLTYPQ